MRRRAFITLLGGAAVWPVAAIAQSSAMPVVALITGAGGYVKERFGAGFRNGLKEAGYVENQNVTVEYHWLDGHYESVPTILDDLIRRRVAVIATPDTSVSLATKPAIATIPMVFGVANDPVALGLVTSVARPGGNATGVNFFSNETSTKRLGLMHELLPNARRFGVLLNPRDQKTFEGSTQSLNEAAPALGLLLTFYNASTVEEIDAVFAKLATDRPDALFIAGDGFFAGRSAQVAEAALKLRLPASFTTRPMVDAGLLMNYGTDVTDAYRQIGVYVGRILKGDKPADLPVFQSTKFDFAINAKTARMLGVTVTPDVLSIADEVIE
jgi:putative tryptophan/tyrosine transport system substrate-binding protein